MANDMESITEIIKLAAGQYCLTFHPCVVKGPVDGHAWSLLVKAYCHAENIPIENVVHDPESDQYRAIASEIEPLKEISSVIGALTSNNELCKKYIALINEQDQSQDDDDITTGEFLEWMAEAGYNMTRPRIFIFDLDHVKNAKQAKTIQSEIELRGYRTKVEIFDDEISFTIRVKVKPLLNLVLEIESFLESIALKFDVKYIGFGI